MLIYLDMCSLLRPFDATDQYRVRVEAAAVLGIIALCQGGGAGLLSSFALDYENDRNPFPLRKSLASELLASAVQYIEPLPEIEQRAAAYQRAGLKPLDASH